MIEGTKEGRMVYGNPFEKLSANFDLEILFQVELRIIKQFHLKDKFAYSYCVFFILLIKST